MKEIHSKHESRMDKNFLSILLLVCRMTAKNRAAGKKAHNSHIPAHMGAEWDNWKALLSSGVQAGSLLPSQLTYPQTYQGWEDLTGVKKADGREGRQVLASGGLLLLKTTGQATQEVFALLVEAQPQVNLHLGLNCPAGRSETPLPRQLGIKVREVYRLIGEALEKDRLPHSPHSPTEPRSPPPSGAPHAGQAQPTPTRFLTPQDPSALPPPASPPSPGCRRPSPAPR